MKLLVKDFFKTKIPVKKNVNNMFGNFQKEELMLETFPQLLERINTWIETNSHKVVNVETLHRQESDYTVVEYIRVWYQSESKPEKKSEEEVYKEPKQKLSIS